MNQKILPLGSVVCLKNGDGTQLLIIARGSIVKQGWRKEVYFDYGAVLIPQGMSNPENVYFFNHENIKEIIFKGFVNEDEIEFANHYDKLIEPSNLIKGSVEE